MGKRRYFRRPAKAQPKPKKEVDIKTDYSDPRVDPELKSVFKKIGVPEPGPFTPDAYQLEALELIKDHDVLVSAPTGAGKTWIASQTIHTYLSRGLRVWYASPLKALSNSIYQQFSKEFGPAQCGILTGDRKENPDAPVVVGTTEILRNQLYDAMHQGTDIRADLVILDEAHYLSDPDRGVVWEEVLIYLPARVKLLLLSATISNAEQVCSWLKNIRGVTIRVVRAEGRPVPLEMLFLFPDGLMVPLSGKRGLNARVKKYIASNAAKRYRRPERIDYGNIINCLRALNLLPAIFFLKSRLDCNRALRTCTSIKRQVEERSQMEQTLMSFLADYPHLEGHRQIRPMLNCKVASHHGGQLPYWKVLVEKMMNQGFLDAIFSTSTVAAGVNFPARTVALIQSDRFNGREFADLTATELHQMIGRAGRRGMDNIGFAVIIPGMFQDPKLIHELKDSPPEPIRSRLHINFSMTLNLLLSHTPPEVKQLVERSFAAFQEVESEISLKNRWDRMTSDLKKALPKGRCDTTDPFEISELIGKRSELKKEIKKNERFFCYEKSVQNLKALLQPGRLFLHKNGNVYAYFRTITDQGRSYAMAHNIKKSACIRKHRFRLRRIDLNQIKTLLDCITEIPDEYTPEMLDRLFGSIAIGNLVPLDMSSAHSGNADAKKEDPEVPALEKKLRSMPCETCEHLKTCHGSAKSPFRKLLREFWTVAENQAGTGGGLWLSFKRHLRFLKETGFVDPFDRLTPDGYWASNLRLDQPLVIAEAIRKGAFDGVYPEILAGGLAPFVWDRTQETGMRPGSGMDLWELEGIFYRILGQIETIRNLKKKRGFDVPPILFWPAAALYMWAKGVPWDELLEFVSVDEGDIASLVMRTADHLRQIVNLRKSHPQLASVAEKAIKLILREPVHID